MKRKQLFFTFLFFLIIVVLGAFIYSNLEGWRLLDSFYFVVMTLTTIGYGDFVPITDFGKVFTIVFSIIGVASMFYFFSLIGSSIFKKHIEAQVGVIKRDTEKQQEIKEDIKEEIKKVGRAKRKKK